MDGNTSQELVVANVDNRVNFAWAYLSFPGNTAPIAGMAVVRTYDSSGHILNETSETLFNIQDYDFFAPYDNLQGVATGLIVLNPGASLTATVRISVTHRIRRNAADLQDQRYRTDRVAQSC